MDELQKTIEDAGIVGAGGAGFPTHMKLSNEAETVIINGAECEPLLRVDQQLMAYKAKELVEGLSYLVEDMGAKKGVIALKGKYSEAIKSLNRQLESYPNIELALMNNFYPAGDEQVMVYDVTGRIVPEAGIPIAVGAVVNNVETVLNIYNKVVNDAPVTDKWVTITGAVHEPCTVHVPIGITVREVLALAGGPSADSFEIINGGPMMGKVVSEDSLITKTTKGLIVLPKAHALLTSLEKDSSRILKEARTACMHCNLCTEVCPRNLLGHRLEPSKLIRIASYGSLCDHNTKITSANLCVECRLCEYACVQNLQPWKINRMWKKRLKEAGIQKDYKDTPEKAHPFREYKKFPVKKLTAMLGLSRYDKPAPIKAVKQAFNKVTMLTSQHIGIPAVPQVKPGDQIKKGDLIARIPDGKMGSHVHSSIDGKVTLADNEKIVIER